MSMLNDLLAKLSESNVSDTEIDKIVENAKKIAEGMGDNAVVQETLAKVMSAATDKKGNKVQKPLEGFNAAYDLAVSGDNGWRDVEPKEAFKKIEDVKNRATALDQPATTYDHQAVASDLIRATRGLKIDTPELSLKTLKMQKELFDGLEGFGHYCTSPEYRLDTYNKSTRYLGDEKIAKAYLEATLPEMKKIDIDGRSLVSDMLEQNILKTKQRFAEIAVLHPHLAEAAKRFSLTAEEKAALAEKKAQYDAIMMPHQKNNYKKSRTTQSFELKNVKDKAKSFIKSSKAYAAGAKLFNAAKEGTVKGWNEPSAGWKEGFKKNIEAFQKNPKLFAVGGAGAMFIGLETMNPPLAAAGTCIMTAAALQLMASKVRDKIKPQEKANNAISASSNKQASAVMFPKNQNQR